jgi:hypothetical protein
MLALNLDLTQCPEAKEGGRGEETVQCGERAVDNILDVVCYCPPVIVLLEVNSIPNGRLLQMAT